MSRLQIRLFGSYFSSFWDHSYDYEPENELKSVLKHPNFRFGPYSPTGCKTTMKVLPEFPALSPFNIDALAKAHGMAKQKFHPTRLGFFSGVKAYIWYVEVLKKRHNAVGWTFCDAINITVSKTATRQ